MNHEQFQAMLDELTAKANVGQEVLGEILARVSLKAPGRPRAVRLPPGTQPLAALLTSAPIPQGTVSKAVKALKDEGLLEDGERSLWSSDGRPLAPLRLGSRYVIAGVSVTQSSEQPKQVTTALLGLDGSGHLGKVRTTRSATGTGPPN